ncbi:DNA repair protein [Streptomyces sp. WM4235]|uniref:non-homologous end joining protein Ku n=1 Tax=unclassified Streptomyces TaxID=2593676 RepID=UPI0006AEC945|nr:MULTISPECIES: Ku protein [unclassified Streptomyces]KOU66081.1 DNA repair protein [Streptomyces sp. WM4235]MCX5073376.1 Ku protein [Streptomyces sp. NBC_00424]WUD43362.1 Ku protein [Streptomyces sp. NBC_00513]
MRATWKGAISFGLVTIPVQLFTATEEHDIPLRQVHGKDGSRVRLRRVCEAEDVEIPYHEITKGYEAPDGSMIMLSDEDLADLPLPSKKLIDVLAFVDASTIDPLMFSKAYYVGTSDRAAAKPYALLREALTESGQIAVTKIAIRSREALAVLRVHEDTLVLQTCLWPDEVRPAAGITPEGDVTIRPQELQMARSLMDMLSQDFDLSALHDEYQEALQQVIEARLQGVEPPRDEEEAAPTGGKVIDLMAALENSVRAARESRGEPAAADGDTDAEVRTLPVPGNTRKTAAEKRAATHKKSAPAKKAAKTTTAKTAQARKATGSAAKKATASPKETGGKKTTATKTTAAKTSASRTAARKSTAASAAKTTRTAKATTTTAKTAAAKKTTRRAASA